MLSFLRRPAAPAEVRSLATPDEFMLNLFDAIPESAGVIVTPATALRVPSVSAGIKAISEAAAGIRLRRVARDEYPSLIPSDDA